MTGPTLTMYAGGRHGRLSTLDDGERKRTVENKLYIYFYTVARLGSDGGRANETKKTNAKMQTYTLTNPVFVPMAKIFNAES